MKQQHRVLRSALALAAILPAGQAMAQYHSGPGCGELYGPGQYGPYDYRTEKVMTPVVTTHHFTAVVENLQSGVKGDNPGEDIDYTLRAIPNHARALAAMQRLGERDHTEQPKGTHYTVACYFERAIRFRPDDNIVRMMYADYLSKRKRLDEAVAQLDYVASTADPENPMTQYNLALLYIGAGQDDKARQCALKAESLGKQISELRARLNMDAAPAAAGPASAASGATPG